MVFFFLLKIISSKKLNRKIMVFEDYFSVIYLLKNN